MPGFNIHIAIGNEYIKRNKIKNKKEFMKGIIYPDIVADKSVSHYSGPRDTNDTYTSLKNKVNLNEYLKNNKIITDYDKGIFLHLITDYLFYNNFFDDEYLKNVEWKRFKNDYYFSLSITDPYVKKKYKTKFICYKKEIKQKLRKFNNYNYYKDSNNIIDKNKIDLFIKEVSEIDINKYKV